ncbi:hypothetical protein GCM10010399_26400 [Dactylosporangium fulvum]
MTALHPPDTARTPATDQVPGVAPLLAARRFLTRETVGDHGRTLHQVDRDQWESFYRDRWRYDRVVRSTHGVNCTGSCSSATARCRTSSTTCAGTPICRSW